MDVRNSSKEPGVFWEAYRQIQGGVVQSIQISFHVSSCPIVIADVLKMN
jgi:hypothetical protein